MLHITIISGFILVLGFCCVFGFFLVFGFILLIIKITQNTIQLRLQSFQVFWFFFGGGRGLSLVSIFFYYSFVMQYSVYVTRRQMHTSKTVNNSHQVGTICCCSLLFLLLFINVYDVFVVSIELAIKSFKVFCFSHFLLVFH